MVTVGDELLSGATANTNATWLCQQLSDSGVTVSRVVVVPDEMEAIAEEVGRLRQRVDRLIVTGGIGPTHDDITMEAVARSLDREMVLNEEARSWLLEDGGYAAEDLVEGTAHLPSGSTPLHNEVGVAPGAKIANIVILPGVPDEMRGMFRTVATEFSGTRVHQVEVTIDEPESALLDRIADLRERFDVTVGSYPGEHVVIRLAGEDESTVREAGEWLTERARTVSTTEVPDPGDRDGDTRQ